MDTTKIQTSATLLENRRIQGDYFTLTLQIPDIASIAQPGQFIHLLIPGLEHRILRRPFSIYDTNPSQGTLTLIYKVVGEGTAQLCQIPKGTLLDVIGPLGNHFTPLPENGVIVAGGFGCAATFMLAKQAPVKPIVLIGGRSAGDILLVKEYQALGCKVQISTDDGSLGTQGRVTELLTHLPNQRLHIASCGPIPMLKTLANIINSSPEMSGELSMDNAMCCGVGACFACVTKVKADNSDGWRYARVCSEGPIFKANDLIFD